MTIFEITSVIGLFVGPVIAAVWTVISQERQRRLISRQMLVSNFLSVHDDPSDISFSVIVRRIPLEFTHNKLVMNAWNEWKNHLDIKINSQENSGEIAKRNRLFAVLLRELSNAVGWKFHESDIQNLTYRSEGFTERMKQQNAAQAEILSALSRIAAAMERLSPPANAEDK